MKLGNTNCWVKMSRNKTIKTISGTLVLLQELERGEAEEGADSPPAPGRSEELVGAGGCVGTKKEPSQKVAEPPGVSASASIT